MDVVADRANPVHCNFQVKVTPQISGSDLVLSWPAVSSATYRIHKTANKFGWDLANYTEVSGTSATLAGEAAGSGTEYYLVV